MPENTGQITIEQRDELPLLRIRNEYADALIALQGGQLLEYTPRGQRPLIWLSEEVAFKRSQTLRGGIPICWPWFGDSRRNPAPVRALVHGEAPAHGLVRAADWSLQAVDSSAEHTAVILRHTIAPDTHAQWPHAALLTLAIAVGRTLRLELTTHNTGAEPLSITQALHTYFAISAIDRVEINGLEQTPYVDTLDDWREKTQQGSIRFDGETDRIYLDTPSHIELRDHGWQRTVTLHARNSASAIVWNPWIEKTRRLSQLAGDAWQRMLCIETANALRDMIVIAPGAQHSLEVEIGCA